MWVYGEERIEENGDRVESKTKYFGNLDKNYKLTGIGLQVVEEHDFTTDNRSVSFYFGNYVKNELLGYYMEFVEVYQDEYNWWSIGEKHGEKVTSGVSYFTTGNKLNYSYKNEENEVQEGVSKKHDLFMDFRLPK